MTDEQPIWRTALNDSSHPLYQAAWMVFSGASSPQFMTKTLESRKEEVIPFLLAIVNEPELYKSTGLGQGKAPFRAMTPLIDWKVMEVVPAMLKAIEYSDLHEDVVDEENEDEIIDEFTAYDAISGYIDLLDESFAETLLQNAETLTDSDLAAGVSFRLAALLPKDHRVFDLITRKIEQFGDVWDKANLVDALLELKIPEKVHWLEGYAKRKEHPQNLKIMLRNRIKADKNK